MKQAAIYLTIILSSVLIINCGKDEYRCESGDSNIVGAKCKDGTRSDATGSGACSHHGGVDYWLCED